jgi:hypothetical protein
MALQLRKQNAALLKGIFALPRIKPIFTIISPASTSHNFYKSNNP